MAGLSWFAFHDCNEQRREIYQCDRFRCATITEIAAKKRSAVVVIIQRCLCLSQRAKRSYGNHSFQIVCSAGRSLTHVFTGILFYSVAIVVIVWKLEMWLGIAWHFLGRSWVDCGNFTERIKCYARIFVASIEVASTSVKHDDNQLSRSIKYEI